MTEYDHILTLWDRVAAEAQALFDAKNADYGDSYHYAGLPGLLVRLLDKINRAHSILAKGRAAVAAETLRDTLIDAGNYSLMALASFEVLQGRMTGVVFSGALELAGREVAANFQQYAGDIETPLFGLLGYLREILLGHVEVRGGEVMFVHKHQLAEHLVETAALCLLLAGRLAEVRN